MRETRFLPDSNQGPPVNPPEFGSSQGISLVTGATGLLGSHIAEQLRASGRAVQALVRPGSDTRFLDSLNVPTIAGDLTDPDACARATRGMETVYHSAAKVGDWGPWSEFQSGCIDATRLLAQAALKAGVRRFVQISSTSAYGHPPDREGMIDESAPLGRRIWVLDHYTRAKVECERLLWDLAERERLPLTVIRPSWLFGERDRVTTPRLAARLKRRQVPLIGRGDNRLSAIHAAEVASAAILAANHPSAEGEAYNVTDQGPITQAEFLGLFADACGAPRPRRKPWVTYWGAYGFGFGLELAGRLVGQKRPPLITRYATWIMGRYLAYDSSKIRKLGWSHALSYKQSIGRTVDWLEQREPHSV